MCDPSIRPIMMTIGSSILSIIILVSSVFLIMIFIYSYDYYPCSLYSSNHLVICFPFSFHFSRNNPSNIYLICTMTIFRIRSSFKMVKSMNSFFTCFSYFLFYVFIFKRFIFAVVYLKK